MTRAARVLCTMLAVALAAALAAVSVTAQPKPLRPWTLILDADSPIKAPRGILLALRAG